VKLETSQPFERYGIVGRSRAVADVIQRIELVSKTRSTVLITGETGTGKELVARAVHTTSAQRAMPFIKVNCAAIPETLLESDRHQEGQVLARGSRFNLS
jgi:transcriptional regulator with GAF, ATPase, and Fis domain